VFADRESSKFLVCQEIDWCQIETEANFIGKVRGRAPTPGSGKKVFFVVVVVRRDGIVGVR